jgi:site-specific recombinase XerD
MNFTEYLQSKKLSSNTVNAYSKEVRLFTEFLEQDNTSAKDFGYNDVMAFMQHCSSKGITNKRLHHLLTVVRHYANYLITQNKRTDNPAAGIYIKGLVRKLPTNLLTTEELEILYKQYALQINVETSKKIMVGILIYQGLRVEELLRVKATHINLLEAKLYVPGTKRSNERYLNLQATQVPLLQDFLQKNKFTDALFFASQKTINNQLQYIFKQLKQLNSKVINAKQIRSSVLTEWLRKNDLRQVQYMAGHKYVSSTERYQTNNLDDLQNELKEHHPMK